jgi:hypothetical protein
VSVVPIERITCPWSPGAHHESGVYRYDRADSHEPSPHETDRGLWVQAADLRYQAVRALDNRLVGIPHGYRRRHTTYSEHTAWAPSPTSPMGPEVKRIAPLAMQMRLLVTADQCARILPLFPTCSRRIV